MFDSVKFFVRRRISRHKAQALVLEALVLAHNPSFGLVASHVRKFARLTNLLTVDAHVLLFAQQLKRTIGYAPIAIFAGGLAANISYRHPSVRQPRCHRRSPLLPAVKSSRKTLAKSDPVLLPHISTSPASAEGLSCALRPEYAVA